MLTRSRVVSGHTNVPSERLYEIDPVKTLKSGKILLDYYATPLIHLVSYIMEVEDATLSCVHHRTLSLCTESLFSYAASPVISNVFGQTRSVYCTQFSIIIFLI